MNKCEYCARFSFFMTDPNDMFHGGCNGEGEGVNRYEESPCGLKLFHDRKEWKFIHGTGCVKIGNDTPERNHV